MYDKLLKIFKHFGVMNQIDKLDEESNEAQKAILEYELCKKYAPNKDIPKEWWEKLKNHIIEEIADCYVVLLQFEQYYDIDDLELREIMNEKIERTLKRIEEGYYDKNKLVRKERG